LWPTKERGVRMNMLGYFGASWPSLYSALRSGIVDADADDLFRRGDRRLPGDRIEREVRRMPRGFLGKFCQRAGGDRFAQRRIVLSEARGEIDDAAIGHGAVFGRAVDGIGREAR
jgi:hypothetical protein